MPRLPFDITPPPQEEAEENVISEESVPDEGP